MRLHGLLRGYRSQEIRWPPGCRKLLETPSHTPARPPLLHCLPIRAASCIFMASFIALTHLVHGAGAAAQHQHVGARRRQVLPADRRRKAGERCIGCPAPAGASCGQKVVHSRLLLMVSAVTKPCRPARGQAITPRQSVSATRTLQQSAVGSNART